MLNLCCRLKAVPCGFCTALPRPEPPPRRGSCGNKGLSKCPACVGRSGPLAGVPARLEGALKAPQRHIDGVYIRTLQSLERARTVEAASADPSNAGAVKDPGDKGLLRRLLCSGLRSRIAVRAARVFCHRGGCGIYSIPSSGGSGQTLCSGFSTIVVRCAFGVRGRCCRVYRHPAKAVDRLRIS